MGFILQLATSGHQFVDIILGVYIHIYIYTAYHMRLYPYSILFAHYAYIAL